MWQREEGGKGTRLGFLCGLILSCVATECSGNLEVNLYTLPSSVSINDWRLETESHTTPTPTPTPTPSHIGRFSEIESRARMFFRVVQACEDDFRHIIGSCHWLTAEEGKEQQRRRLRSGRHSFSAWTEPHRTSAA